MEHTPARLIPTIGLEIHAELKTASKMFCPCKNDPDEERPNANVCPICLGHPGTLPVLNRAAIERVLSIGAAVGGTLADFTEWDRKNYFYPDIPKGYQISQYKHPLVSGGSLAGIGLERIHLEEDTARSTHDQHQKSLIDFNRSGVPLMELVTAPAIHDAATAVRFAKELQLLLRYLGAGEANLEKGEMRVEANVSVATPEDTAAGRLGVKTEVKNLNSFRAVEGAIAYEIQRQSAILEKNAAGDASEKVVQETRGWDDKANETYSQRSKESSHDYRYFPDPDIPKMKLSEMPGLSGPAIAAALPELPWAKRERLARDYAMTEKEAAVFVDDDKNVLAPYLEAVAAALPKRSPSSVRLAINYFLTDYLGLLKKALGAAWMPSLRTAVAPGPFAELIGMIDAGEVNSRAAKDILALMVAEPGAAPRALAEKHGLLQKSDAASLEPAIDKVISENAKAVSEYKAGKAASLQFLIGMAMKATKGAGNPAAVKDMLVKKLS
ncbi:MAG: Asp-tRNA(Asn)/Glu-tRNA(Gln) amidotransferase subunit GatB [Patescibacteria group bacterium]|nr:Asp-tRNA(Asn)/Glu-tRNA(Gln) amidotransferase subunit GatB [Patescibacteria group bacterium]